MKPILTIMVFVLFAFTSIARSGDKLSTEELLQNLKDRDAQTREKAAKELGDRGEKLGLDALVQATADKDEKVQMAAVRAIGEINDPRQISALSQAIHNTNGEPQKEAIHLLTEHYIPTKDQSALTELFASIEKLFNPPHPIAVQPWIRVDPEAIDVLTYVLDNKTSSNRIQAAATLGILRAQSAIPRLAYYLASPNQQMVRTCVRSIGYIGLPESGSYLIPLLKHPDQQVVMDASRVLGQFRYKPALSELQHLLDYSKDTEYQQVALQAISRIGDPSSEPTIKQYYVSDNKYLRQYAIEGVGRMGLKKYMDALERDFQRENSRQIKLAQCFSLFSLGDTAYIDTLVRSIDDRLYRDQVREYLIELGPVAVHKVADYLKSSDKEQKIRLIRTLGEMHQPTAIQYLEPYLKDQDIEVVQAATDAVRELRQSQKA